MDYNETVKFLENLQKGKIKTEIDNIKKAFKELGNPQKRFTSIHIAGTNGKGSIGVMIDSILREAGYSTGLYTSPHISEFTERLKVSNNPISESELSNYVKRFKTYFEKYKCTYFEAATIICFIYFHERKIDIAVVETGMGGRWDATNVLNPIITVITDLGLEHQTYLGTTIEKIAAEKGGIIKTGADCIVSATQKDAVKTMKNTAKNQNAAYYQVYLYSKVKLKNMNINGTTFDYSQRDLNLKDLFIPLTGLHQVKNARTAIFTINRLKNLGFFVKNKDIINGLKNVKLDGRFETINKKPHIILDVGHNPDAFKVIKQTVKALFPSKKIFLLFGTKLDKDYQSMIRIIKPICREIVGIKLNNQNSLEPKKLIDITKKLKIKYTCFNSSEEGLKFLLKRGRKKDIILAAGSHITVSEIKDRYFYLKNR